MLEAKFGLASQPEPAKDHGAINKAARRRAQETTDILVRQLWEAGIHVPDRCREVRFHPERKWKFDVAWVHWMVAVEIQGTGNHRTIKGFKRDCEKFSAAFALGWSVVPVTHRMVRTGEAARLIVQGLSKRGFTDDDRSEA